MINRLLNKVFLLGVNNEFSRDVNRAITISNQLSLLASAICLSMYLLQGSLFGWDTAATTAGAVGLGFIVPLVANYWGWTLFSRIFVSVYFPTSILLASLFSKITDISLAINYESHYYGYRFFIIVAGVAALVLYDQRNRWWSFFSIAYIALLLLLFDPLHNYFGVGFYQTGHQDDSYFFITIVVLLAYAGQVAGLFILRCSIDKNERDLLSEIEERKRVENEIIQAKKVAEVASETKSEFLANVSHEIRTPLNGIIGFSDLLTKTELTQTQIKYASIIYQSGNSLLKIVDDLLDFSKIEAKKFELSMDKTNLRELCGQVTDMIKYQAGKKGLKVTLTMSADCPQVIWADEARLRQVLINLLANAVKFTQAGEVELKIEALKSIRDGETRLRFSVQDTGIGIDPKNQQKIFEAFVQEDISNTKKYGGTGLGLTISKELLSLMNSRLEVESEKGKGSIFHFTISFNSEI